MDIGEEPLWNLGWLLVSPFWREAHFFVYHYLLHCRPLYRWFHAHHHKSYNPGPWSGLSMHPVESISYFTGPVVLAWWCRSPFVWLYANIHAEIASVYGHHGYEEYGGSYFHYLHHAKAEKNYGVGCKHALSTNDNPPTHIHAHTHTPHTIHTTHTPAQNPHPRLVIQTPFLPIDILTGTWDSGTAEANRRPAAPSK